MDNNERRKKIREQLKESGIKNKKNSITLTCILCNKTDEIHINNPIVYTEEIIKNYQCWRHKKQKVKKEIIKEKQIDQKTLDIVEKQESKQEEHEIPKTIIKKPITRAIIEIFTEDFISIEDASEKIANMYSEKEKNRNYFIRRISDILKSPRYQPKNYDIEKSEDNKYRFVKK